MKSSMASSSSQSSKSHMQQPSPDVMGGCDETAVVRTECRAFVTLGSPASKFEACAQLVDGCIPVRLGG
jgi:hypothetical protein